LLNVCSSVLFHNSYIKLKLTFQLSLNTSHFDNYCRKVNERYNTGERLYKPDLRLHILLAICVVILLQVGSGINFSVLYVDSANMKGQCVWTVADRIFTSAFTEILLLVWLHYI